MPDDRNIRSLRVRPSRSADISFNLPGVLGTQNSKAILGSTAAGYDIRTLYSRLGDLSDDPASLKYGASAIREELTGGASAPFLLALRNESVEASLDQLLARRASVFRERFVHADGIVSDTQKQLTLAKEHLEKLAGALAARQQAFEKLVPIGSPQDTAHSTVDTTVKLPKVVTKTTTYASHVGTVSDGLTKGRVGNGEYEHMWTAVHETEKEGKHAKYLQVHQSGPTLSRPVMRNGTTWDNPRFDGKDPNDKPITDMYRTQEAYTESPSGGDPEQVSTSGLPQLVHPRLDSEIAYRQTAARIAEEWLRVATACRGAEHARKIMGTELEAINLEIRVLQVNLLNTYLFAPFDGVITAVYKDLGESVEAGEPVMRVEDDSTVLLVGQVRWPKAIWINQDAIIHCKDLFETGIPFPAPEGKVVSVRGHESDDDEWDVMIRVENGPLDPKGRRPLPINGSFDPDTTTVEFR